jgi:hypothetical protein
LKNNSKFEVFSSPSIFSKKTVFPKVLADTVSKALFLQQDFHQLLWMLQFHSSISRNVCNIKAMDGLRTCAFENTGTGTDTVRKI